MDNDLPLNDNTQNIPTSGFSITPDAPQQPQPVAAPQPSTEPVSIVGLGADLGTGMESVPIDESLPVSEKQPVAETLQQSVEQLHTPEIPVPAAISDPTPEAPKVVQPLISEPPSVVPNVVDKRTLHDSLKPIKGSSDQLTIAADQEEEEFIKQVEEVHDSK